MGKPSCDLLTGTTAAGFASRLTTRVTPGVKIVDSLAADIPFAFAVAEGGRPGTAGWDALESADGSARERRRGAPTRPEATRRSTAPLRRPVYELLQDRTEIAFAAFEHRANQHSARRDEKLTPDYSRCFEYIRPEWLDFETRLAQGFGGRCALRSSSLRSLGRDHRLRNIRCAVF